MDEKLEKKRTKRLQGLERARKIRLDEFMRGAMSLPQGREFLYWLLEISKVRRNPYTANALSTAFQCGEMNVGQQIEAYMTETSPSDYVLMLQEKAKEEADARRDAPNDDADDSSDDRTGETG